MERDPRNRLALTWQGRRLSAFLDTNVLIRHLTGDPPDQARRATRLLRTGKGLILTDLVVAECVYVLRSVYRVDIATIAMMLRAAFALQSIEVPALPILTRALELLEDGKLSFVDSYLVACAEQSGVGAVASFDRAIDRTESFRRITG